MAEQKTGKTKLSDDDKKFNRQINYFIMRYMWQVIHGRSADNNIYLTFGTSRERYTRTIDTGVIRYGKNELNGLSQLTGIRQEIFTGEVRFNCPYKVRKPKTKDEKEPTIEERVISTGDWERLFQWRKNRTGVKGTQSPQDEICARLKKVSRTNIENWDFYRMCYFFKSLEPAPLYLTAAQFRENIALLNQLSFSLLDLCSVEQLTELNELLRKKQSLVAGILMYKDEQRKNKRK